MLDTAYSGASDNAQIHPEVPEDHGVLSLWKGKIVPYNKFGGKLIIPDKVVQEAIQAACEAYGVTSEDILGRSHKKKHAIPRHAVMALLRSYTFANGEPKYGLLEIARVLRRKDHTTVLFGLRRHAERMGVAQ